jgi:hypothetical protein
MRPIDRMMAEKRGGMCVGVKKYAQASKLWTIEMECVKI